MSDPDPFETFEIDAYREDLDHFIRCWFGTKPNENDDPVITPDHDDDPEDDDDDPVVVEDF